MDNRLYPDIWSPSSLISVFWYALICGVHLSYPFEGPYKNGYTNARRMYSAFWLLSVQWSESRPGRLLSNLHQKSMYIREQLQRTITKSRPREHLT